MRLHIALAAASCLIAFSSHAQVRVEPDTASFVDPSTGPLARALFGRSGYFMIAGGVVLGGTASFYLERDNSDQPIDAASVHLHANAGGVSLAYGGISYQVGMPAGLACPLGRFVARDGIIAYTVPKFLDPGSRQMMIRAGLKHHRIAREFDGTVFEPLLHAADFAQATPLPTAIAHSLTSSLNKANGLGSFVIDAADETEKPLGSLINTDAQVRYRVYLLAATQRVEIAGVPLRYFWELDRGGAAGVFAVDAFAQTWPAGTRLTDWSAPGAKPTQYDVVNFYQVSGLFRQLHLIQPLPFEKFVASSCKE